MNIKEIGDVFHCDCGFSWSRGKNGNHNCANGLREKVRQLAAENVGLKAAHPQPFGPEMMKALDAYEKQQDKVPEAGMLDAFFILRDSIRLETPATDAYLAGIKADGVEMAIEHIAQTICPNHETVLKEFAAQLREGAK